MGENTISDSFFCGKLFFLVILLSAECLKTSCTGKRKKKNQNKKQGGVPSGSIYHKSLDFPWSFPALLGQALALPRSFQLDFWGRDRLCGFSGVCTAPCQAQGEAGSMQEAPRGTRSRVLRITPWAEGGPKPLSHPGCPIISF